MKRKIAKKKLQRKCITCGTSFKKDNVYYVERIVYTEYGGVSAYEYIQCPKCVYKDKEHKRRFDKFKPNCKHKLTYEVWSYILGECVKQPDHKECLICGEWI